jgi:8-oxo-dGTP pyrophosphatase MutT (NUDIX family)
MSKLLYRRPWISLYENDDGIAHVQMDDAVMVVPVTRRGEILFIHEHSVAYGRTILNLPTGTIEPHEPPLNTANRELQEEIGYRAGRLDLLGEVYPVIKYLRLKMVVYLARDLKRSKLQGDEQWKITIERIGLSQLDKVILSGRVQDSSVITALILARTFLATNP